MPFENVLCGYGFDSDAGSFQQGFLFLRGLIAGLLLAVVQIEDGVAMIRPAQALAVASLLAWLLTAGLVAYAQSDPAGHPRSPKEAKVQYP